QGIWVQGADSTFNAVLTVGPAGFTNAGTLRLETLSGGWDSRLEVQGGGTLINTGVRDVEVGSGGGSLVRAGPANSGTGDTATNTNFDQNSAHHRNDGTIDVASGATLTVIQSGTAPSFANNGTIDIHSGSTLNISSGSFTNFSA